MELTRSRTARLIEKIFNNKYVYKIAVSPIFMLIQTAFAAYCFNTGKIMLALWVFLSILLVLSLIVKDVSALFLPLMLLAMAMLGQYRFKMQDYWHLVSLVVPILVILGLKPLLFYYTPFKLGKLMPATIIVAIAVSIGGIGNISYADYTNLVSLYYVGGLGIGVIIAYFLIRNFTLNDEVHRPIRVLCWAMICIGIMGICMIYPVAIEKLVAGEAYRVQWKNNLATFFILSMPFAFYISTRAGKLGFFGFVMGLAQYIGILFAASRGGLIAGTMLFIACLAASVIYNNKFNRILFALIIVVTGVALGALIYNNPNILPKIAESVKIDQHEVRWALMREALENFMKYPINGVGIGYMGHTGYVPAKGAMYWCHNTPFQVIGSMGLIGIAAYAYQLYARLKICFSRQSKFALFGLLAFGAFEVMGVVNPCDFTPIPFVAAISVVLTYIEIVAEKPLEKGEELNAKREDAYVNHIFRGTPKR